MLLVDWSDENTADYPRKHSGPCSFAGVSVVSARVESIKYIRHALSVSIVEIARHAPPVGWLCRREDLGAIADA